MEMTSAKGAENYRKNIPAPLWSRAGKCFRSGVQPSEGGAPLGIMGTNWGPPWYPSNSSRHYDILRDGKGAFNCNWDPLKRVFSGPHGFIFPTPGFEGPISLISIPTASNFVFRERGMKRLHFGVPASAIYATKRKWFISVHKNKWVSRHHGAEFRS